MRESPRRVPLSLVRIAGCIHVYISYRVIHGLGIVCPDERIIPIDVHQLRYTVCWIGDLVFSPSLCPSKDAGRFRFPGSGALFRDRRGRGNIVRPRAMAKVRGNERKIKLRIVLERNLSTSSGHGESPLYWLRVTSSGPFSEPVPLCCCPVPWGNSDRIPLLGSKPGGTPGLMSASVCLKRVSAMTSRCGANFSSSPSLVDSCHCKFTRTGIKPCPACNGLNTLPITDPKAW